MIFWLFTDKNACIRWALTVANGLPLTKTVNVSSFSVVIRLPNQDFFVSSGDDSGVRCTSSVETAKEKMIICKNLEKVRNSFEFLAYFVIFVYGIWDYLGNYF